MTDQPLVSIIIPVYNGANYLREAISSSLEQTYPRCEVIVVNDGSVDNGATRDIALSFGSRIRYFEKENGGVATALNRGIREMNGEYFSWLSHDDLYLPHKIERQMDFLRSNSLNNVVLYSNFEFIDEKGVWIGAAPDVRGITPESFRVHLIKAYPIHGCTALIPVACFQQVGFFNEHLISTQDYDLWFRMSKHIPFIYDDVILSKTRLHENQGTRTLGAPYISECNALNIRCLDEMVGVEKIPGYSSKAFFALSMARGLLHKGHYAASHHAYVLSEYYVDEMKLSRRILYYFESLYYWFSLEMHSYHIVSIYYRFIFAMQTLRRSLRNMKAKKVTTLSMLYSLLLCYQLCKLVMVFQ